MLCLHSAGFIYTLMTLTSPNEPTDLTNWPFDLQLAEKYDKWLTADGGKEAAKANLILIFSSNDSQAVDFEISSNRNTS